MKIFSEIDAKKNLIKGPLISGEDVFENLEEPLFGFVTRSKKQIRFEEREIFIQLLEKWNKRGFNTLATFLSRVLNYSNNIMIRDVNLDDLSFTVLNGEEKAEIKLGKRIDEDSHPMITVTQGSLTKEYVCDNIAKEGLLINLSEITIQKGDRTVTRSFSSKGNSFRIYGLGYLTEILMPRSSKKLLITEEKILEDLLETDNIKDVINTFKFFHLHAGEELRNGTTNIRIFRSDERDALNSPWEEVQSLKVFVSVLMTYKTTIAFNNYSASCFTREITGDFEYLDNATGDPHDPHVINFFATEKDRCEELITFLNKYTDERPKELKYTGE